MGQAELLLSGLSCVAHLYYWFTSQQFKTLKQKLSYHFLCLNFWIGFLEEMFLTTEDYMIDIRNSRRCLYKSGAIWYVFTMRRGLSLKWARPF